jgi:hypothetical protein
VQHWTIIGSQDDESFFDDHVRSILAQDRQPLPAREQSLGPVELRWEAVGSKTAFVQAIGGTHDDRLLARAFLVEQLRGHGWREATKLFDRIEKTATWQDIMQKAKRLIQDGNVKLLRNGYQNIVAQVQGDHGTYQCEVFRQDPSSRSITGSDCECDWGEFQNQPRTRQWKKFQDRPCAHILAAYWLSLSTPLDEDVHPDNPASGPLGPTPTFPAGTEGFPQGQGFEQQPGGAPAPGVGPDDMGGSQSPDMSQMGVGTPMGAPGAQGPPQAAPGPSPRDVLPQFPMQGLQQGQINPASVPGQRGPTPTNPVAYPGGPGGTFSSIRRSVDQQYQNGGLAQLRFDDKANLVGRTREGEEVDIPGGSVGEVLGTHPTTGMVNVLWMGQQFDDNGRMQPFGASGWHFPSYLIPRPDAKRPGPAVRRVR